MLRSFLDDHPKPAVSAVREPRDSERVKGVDELTFFRPAMVEAAISDMPVFRSRRQSRGSAVRTIPARWRLLFEVDYFRVADAPGAIRKQRRSAKICSPLLAAKGTCRRVSADRSAASFGAICWVAEHRR
jgi:hypothetical protein